MAGVCACCGVARVELVGATALALWWLGPTLGVAWGGSLQNVFGYQGLCASEWSLRELAANHSAFTLVKLAAMMTGMSLRN